MKHKATITASTFSIQNGYSFPNTTFLLNSSFCCCCCCC